MDWQKNKLISHVKTAFKLAVSTIMFSLAAIALVIPLLIFSNYIKMTAPLPANANVEHVKNPAKIVHQDANTIRLKTTGQKTIIIETQ